ncbi:hypothetical protein ACSNOI_45980, partial [Actinomadura kijaniata]|uniref:hypothetical protein n=1 Tax=Actinomadura kijaniata TaxID=46161 RepID=UPI003F1B832A
PAAPGAGNQQPTSASNGGHVMPAGVVGGVGGVGGVAATVAFTAASKAHQGVQNAAHNSTGDQEGEGPRGSG